MKKKFIYYVASLALAVSLIASCSATTNYQVLSTFFDGVPNPNEKITTKKDSIIVDTLTNEKEHIAKINDEPEFIYHPPYRNRMCKGCHNTTAGNELIKKIPELCYNCHENITQKNPALHGPVAMGDCNVCHSPHLAKNKYLLVREGRNLCLYCHESLEVKENKNHFAAEEFECLYCHDPHSGKDRFLLN